MIDANYKVKQKRILHHSQSVAVIGQIDFQNVIADDIAFDHFLIHPVCLIRSISVLLPAGAFPSVRHFPRSATPHLR